MLLIIVATGNHFFFDAVAGGLVVAAGWVTASRLSAPAPVAEPVQLHASHRIRSPRDLAEAA